MASKTSGKAGQEALTWQSEDYLEAIAKLQQRDRVARAKDIAQRLGVTRGTVTSALKGLQDKGLINYQPYSHITLTPQGEILANEIIHRHETLARYLREVLQIPPDMAEANACRAEHVLDPEVIEHMICFMEFLDRCPRTNELWRQAYDNFCQGEQEEPNCKECLGQSLAEIYTQKDLEG